MIRNAPVGRIKYVPLNPLTSSHLYLLGDRPVTMIIPVLESMMTIQKSLRHNSTAPIVSAAQPGRKGGRSAPKRKSTTNLRIPKKFEGLLAQIAKNLFELRKSG